MASKKQTPPTDEFVTLKVRKVRLAPDEIRPALRAKAEKLAALQHAELKVRNPLHAESAPIAAAESYAYIFDLGPTDVFRIQSAMGYFEFSGNEHTTASTIDDSSKGRFADYRGGGAISWNRGEPGRQEEFALLQGKLAERDRPNTQVSGEMTLHLQDPRFPGDEGMTRKLFADWSTGLSVESIGGHGGTTVVVDGGYTPAPGPDPTPPNPSVTELYSHDRAYRCVDQIDGNFVVYRTDTETALWDRFSYEGGTTTPPVPPTEPPPTQPPTSADHSEARSAMLFTQMQGEVQQETGQWVEEGEGPPGVPDHVTASRECVEQEPWKSNPDPLHAMIFGIGGNLVGTYKEQYLRRGQPSR